jgi:sarcosine oxidase subunit alpha
LVDTDRPGFVGVKAIDAAQRFRAGAHFVPIGAARKAANDHGWISSVAFSPSLNAWIGLGFVKGGQKRIGERMLAHDPLRNAEIEVELCAPVFVDPEGVRLRG